MRRSGRSYEMSMSTLLIILLLAGLGLLALGVPAGGAASGAGDVEATGGTSLVVDRYDGEFGLEAGFKLAPFVVLIVVLVVYLGAGVIASRRGGRDRRGFGPGIVAR